jgi:hypothetical protein
MSVGSIKDEVNSNLSFEGEIVVSDPVRTKKAELIVIENTEEFERPTNQKPKVNSNSKENKDLKDLDEIPISTPKTFE